MRCLNFALLVLGLQVLAIPGAAAHEGHDHGAPPPPVSSTVAPRMEAATNDLELVAVAGATEVAIYLNSFRTNEPIQGAVIDIDAGGETLRRSLRATALMS